VCGPVLQSLQQEIERSTLKMNVMQDKLQACEKRLTSIQVLTRHTPHSSTSRLPVIDATNLGTLVDTEPLLAHAGFA
jgi:hypothetical protein